MSKLILKSNKDRKTRTPFGAQRIQGMIPNMDKRFHYHWINDVPGRLTRALDGGYEFVTKEGEATTAEQGTDLGSMLSRYAGRDSSGQPYKRYAMRIRNEWYEEDVATKQALVDETDMAMRAGKFKHGAESKNMYVPESGIKFS